MSKTPALIVLSGASLLLTACGSTGLLGRDRPDEFAVQRQAPLVIPPDFALVPPVPGAPRPTDSGAAQQAQDALFGPPSPRSSVETTVNNRSGQAAPSIRSTVGDPSTATVAKGSVTRDIVAAPEGDGREAQASLGN